MCSAALGVSWCCHISNAVVACVQARACVACAQYTRAAAAHGLSIPAALFSSTATVAAYRVVLHYASICTAWHALTGCNDTCSLFACKVMHDWLALIAALLHIPAATIACACCHEAIKLGFCWCFAGLWHGNYVAFVSHIHPSVHLCYRAEFIMFSWCSRLSKQRGCSVGSTHNQPAGSCNKLHVQPLTTNQAAIFPGR